MGIFPLFFNPTSNLHISGGGRRKGERAANASKRDLWRLKGIMKISEYNLGLIGYNEALSWQLELHNRVCCCQLEGALIICQHPVTITLGKHGKTENILVDKNWLISNGIEVIRSSRGGQVTAHMPGQLVIYPIIPVKHLNLTPKKYVALLEKTIVTLLAEYGLKAYSDPKYPGVWIANSKICALGIRIKTRVAMHGLALNVNNDLGLFTKIVPCGLKGKGVTSVSEQLSYSVNMESITERFREIFKRNFEIFAFQSVPCINDRFDPSRFSMAPPPKAVRGGVGLVIPKK